MRMAKLSFFREPKLLPDDEFAVLASQGLATEVFQEVPHDSSEAALNRRPSEQDTDQEEHQGSIHAPGEGEGDGRTSLCSQGHDRA
jgi:hypothetical protein